MTAHLRPRTSLRVALCAAAVAALLAMPATAHAADSIFAVTGRGWGHGIGMSQYGAKGYAEQGWGYKRILGWYFQKTTVATRSELTVKVDLDDGKDARSSWLIASPSIGTTMTLMDVENTTHTVQVARGTAAWITFSGGGAVLRSDRYDSAAQTHTMGSVVATFPGSAVAYTGARAVSQVRILGASGPFSRTNIVWRGHIRFTPDTATTGNAIDWVPMDQYLRGVVPNESPRTWPVEALRAQAVAARSYAYDAAKDGKVLWCTTMSQVYNGAPEGLAIPEYARTDAAVADTHNEFVVYGSSVVQAFFSSSSGGRTANSKDVWFSSRSDDKSPVYYTTVADADSDSPNYRWSLADMTGATLAGKVREDYPSDAQPSPATVTAVKLEKGTSGFVRYVTLTWSKGESTVLTGPQFQHALGLKSSAFTVTLKNPPPPPATRFQDTDARPLWGGTWASSSSSSASGGTYRHTGTAGAALTVMFKGTSVSWIGLKGAGSGRADVSLDGTRLATIDLYASSTSYKVTVWTKTGLAADTTHTLVIKVLGTHRTGARGSGVGVDAIDVAGTLLTVPRPPAWKRLQQNTSASKYSGTWKTSTLPGLSGGTHAFSKETTAAVVHTFTGTRVRWIGKRATNYGKAWVSIDGSVPVLIDLYSAATLNQQRLFESAALTPGTHKLTVRVAGKKNAKATDDYVDIDAFEVLQPVQ